MQELKGGYEMIKDKDKSFRYSIGFLKLALWAILFLIVVVSTMILYELVSSPVDGQEAGFFYPVFAGVYISLLPVIYSGVQFYRLLSALKKGIQLKPAKTDVLRKLKIASAAYLTVFLLLYPFVYRLADASDTPELMIIFGLPVLFTLIWLAVLSIFQES